MNSSLFSSSASLAVCVSFASIHQQWHSVRSVSVPIKESYGSRLQCQAKWTYFPPFSKYEFLMVAVTSLEGIMFLIFLRAQRMILNTSKRLRHQVTLYELKSDQFLTTRTKCQFFLTHCTHKIDTCSQSLPSFSQLLLD